MTAKAIVNLIPEHRQASFAPDLAEQRERVGFHEARLTACVAQFTESDSQRWAEALAGRWTPNACNPLLWNAWAARRDMLKPRRELERLEKEAAKPDTPAKTEIAVLYSFAVKDALKARGYRFSPEAAWDHGKTLAGWLKSFAPGVARNEVVWLREQGIQIEDPMESRELVGK